MVDNTALNNDWIRLQEEFWGNQGANEKGNDLPFNEWFKDVDDYWQGNIKDASNEVNSLYQKLFSSSRVFFNFSEPFVASSYKKEKPESILSEYLESYVETIEKAFANGGTSYENNFSNNHIQLWQQQFNHFGELPESFLKFIKSASENSVANDEFVKACESYIKVFAEYQSAYLVMTLDASREMLQQFQGMNEADTSVNQIFTLWLDISERNYAGFIRSSNYPELYADVINAWMVLIQQTQQLVVPWLEAMNLPTRDFKNAK